MSMVSVAELFFLHTNNTFSSTSVSQLLTDDNDYAAFWIFVFSVFDLDSNLGQVLKKKKERKAACLGTLSATTNWQYEFCDLFFPVCPLDH